MVTKIEKHPTFKRSAEVMDLLKILPEVIDEATYRELTERSGVSLPEKSWALRSARKILEKEERICFGVIRGVGIKRLNDAEIVDTGKAKLRHIQRTANAGAKTQFCVEAARLDPEKRAQFNAQTSLFMLYAHSAKGKTREVIESRCLKVDERLTLARTLEALRES